MIDVPSSQILLSIRGLSWSCERAKDGSVRVELSTPDGVCVVSSWCDEMDEAWDHALAQWECVKTSMGNDPPWAPAADVCEQEINLVSA